MAVRPWALLTLCDGYGGTELALRSVARVSTVARVERDAYAAAVLVARMEEARLDQAPIWDDLHTFDGRPWCGRVDLVAAGFPCQPFSSAGARGGTGDDRWLWPSIARIISDVRPGWVLLENVRGLVRHGLPHVLADLARFGFDAEWGMYSAAAVGAPHKRERFWLVAHTNRDGLAQVGQRATGRARNADRRDGALGWAWPPGPDDHTGWADYIAAGGPQPVVRRSTDGPPLGLADALHLGGNGLVPECAAEAWRQLLAR